jgi:hypothetical protein
MVDQLRPFLASLEGSERHRREVIQGHPAYHRRIALEVANSTRTRQDHPILVAMRVANGWVDGFGNFESNPNGHEFWFKDSEVPLDINVNGTPLKFGSKYADLGGVPGYTEAEVAKDARLSGKLRVTQHEINEAIEALSQWEYGQGYPGAIGQDMATMIIALSEAARNRTIESGIIASFRSAENQSGLPQLDWTTASSEFHSWDSNSRAENADREKYQIANMAPEEVDQRASEDEGSGG